MKVLIFILLVVASYSQPLLGGFEPIDIDEAQNNADIQNLIDYGMQDVVQQGYQSQEFTSESFQLTRINSVQKQVFNGENYKFNCEFTNEESTTIQAEFEIHIDSFTYEKTVVSSTYKVVSSSMEENIEQSYSEVDESEIKYSDEVQSVLNYGMEGVVQKIKGKASNSKIVKIISVERQIVQAAFFYKCNVNIINIQTQKITNAIYIVYYQPSMDQKALIDYSVDNQSDTNEIIAPIEENYMPLDVQTVDHDQNVKDCLDYGIDEVKKIGVSEKKITSTTFSISKVYQVETQILGDGVFYKFDCDLKNKVGITVKTKFTVYYSVSTSTYQLTQYNYDVQSAQTDMQAESPEETVTSQYTNSPNSTDYALIPTEQAEEDAISQQCLDYGFNEVIDRGIKNQKIPDAGYQISKVVSVSKKVITEGVYFKYVCEAMDGTGSTVTMNFMVYYKYSSMTTSLASYSFKSNAKGNHAVQTKKVNVEKSSYTQMSSSEITYSSEVQSCIDYGVQQIVQSSDYKVTKTNSVYRKVEKNAIYYKFDVDVTSNEGKTTGLSCIVNYNPQIEQKYLQAYSYYTKKVEESSYSSNTSTITNPDGSSSSISSTSSSYSSRQFTQISTSSVQTNSKYKSILKSGVDQCVQNLVSSNVVSSSSFSVVKVKKVFSQKRTSQEDCVFSVQLTNEEGVSVDVNLNVNYKAKTGQKTLTSYFVEGYSSTQDSKDVTVVDYNNNQISAASYEKISSSKSLQSKTAIQYGVQEVVKQVSEKESLLATDFKVTKIQNVYQEMINSSSYTVVATMMNSKKQSIDCSFSVNYLSSKSKSFNSYSYVLY